MDSPARLEGTALTPVGAATLQLVGPPGSGKSALLAEVAERSPGAIHLDCRGLTATEVLAAITAALDANALPSSLPTVVEEYDDQVTVILANSQWVGANVATNEPNLLSWNASRAFVRSARKRVLLITEGDPGRMAVGEAGEYVVTVDDAPRPWDNGLLSVPALRVLAQLESPTVDFGTWEAMCALLEVPLPSDGLRSLVRRSPDTLRATGEEAQHVEFVDPGTRSFLRRALPLTREEHERLVRALLGASAHPPGSPGDGAGPLTTYASGTLANHAALAGTLLEHLDSPSFLARTDRRCLMNALGLTDTRPLPHNSLAKGLLRLHQHGVFPPTQEEWVAWVHWLAVTQGRGELASGIADTGVATPWITVWSRWSAPALFGDERGDLGPVRGLVSGNADGRAVVSGWVVAGESAFSDEDEGQFEEQVVDAANGDVLFPDLDIDGYLDDHGRLVPESDRPYRADSNDTVLGQPGVPLPAALPDVVDAVRTAGDGRWVFGGDGGMYCLEVRSPGSTNSPGTWERWNGGWDWMHPHRPVHQSPGRTSDHVAAMRASLASRAGWEALLGDGVCRVLTDDELPPQVTEEGARDFLRNVGLPVVSGLRGLPMLVTERSPHPVPGGREEEGERVRIGSWAGSPLLLDGATGGVLRGTPDGPHVLLGSGLRTFWELVCLYQVGGSGWDKARYAAIIDPDAAPSHSWY